MAFNNTPAFWEKEAPEVITTDKNTIRYYPEAKVVSVQGHDYYDPRTGELKTARLSVLHLAALKKNPEAAKRLAAIILDTISPNTEGIADV